MAQPDVSSAINGTSLHPKVANMAQGDMNEAGKAALSKMRGTTAASMRPGSQEQRDYVAAQGNMEAQRKPISESFRKKSEDDAAFAGTGVPKLHKGGVVPADGIYNLRAGEHVLTAPEAAKARKHALIVSGMKSLVKAGKKTAGEPEPTPYSHAPINDIKVRPSKSPRVIAGSKADSTKKSATAGKKTSGEPKPVHVRSVSVVNKTAAKKAPATGQLD